LPYEQTFVDNGNHTPERFTLLNNYPNPFNSSTTISYNLATTARVSIEVYNLLGRQVTTLICEEQQPGSHQVAWNAGDIPSGVYFYRIHAGNIAETKKMLLLK